MPVYNPKIFPQISADATLAQAAAVQNTWYTVLSASNVRVFYISIMMATAAEDLEVKVTIDGLTWTGAQAAAVAGTPYVFRKDSYYTTTLTAVSTATSNPLIFNNESIDAHNFLYEIRKTTANGANVLNGRVVYAKW